jgi:Domain of unknown function (DUF5658)
MQQAILLFTLNFLDAGLTLFWTETGRATEANQLMQYFLDGGPAVFLIFKFCIGMFAALCFYRWAHLTTARVGLKLSLAVYTVICAIHVGVGLVASGVTGWIGL